MTLELDHVIVCLPDLEESARRFERDYEVTSLAGGRHAGHGTGNRIVPLGSNYIELMSVVDEHEARSSSLGRWALSRVDIPGADAVCLRTDDLKGVCARLGLAEVPMSRLRRDGLRLNWRLAGLEDALARNLPFFITWDVEPDQHPGGSPVTHRAGDVGLGMVTIQGPDVDELRQWAPDPVGVSYAEGDVTAISFSLEFAA